MKSADRQASGSMLTLLCICGDDKWSTKVLYHDQDEDQELSGQLVEQQRHEGKTRKARREMKSEDAVWRLMLVSSRCIQHAILYGRSTPLLSWFACPWRAALISVVRISAIDDCISHSMLHTRTGCTVLMCTMLDTLLIICEQCGLILCTGLMMVVDANSY
jgi:hypothetical protein